MKIAGRSESLRLLLSGELDMATADELRSIGIRALASLGERARLDVDMAALTFIDSSGLGALISIRNAAEDGGHEVALMNVSPSIVRLLELTGLRDAFTILPAST